MLLLRSIVVSASICLFAAPVLGQTELVPYGAGGYRYMAGLTSFPGGVESPAFDDSGWPTGAALFGQSAAGCGLPAERTPWPVGTLLVARYRLTLPGAAGAPVLHFAIDNDVSVYINGSLAAALTHEGCASLDEHAVPIAGLLHAGDNVIVALATDRGVISAFDMRITADFVTASRGVSWGALKAAYR